MRKRFVPWAPAECALHMGEVPTKSTQAPSVGSVVQPWPRIGQMRMRAQAACCRPVPSWRQRIDQSS